jgi:chromosome segregation ATPase
MNWRKRQVPQKTNSDLIREIASALQTAETRVDNLQRDVDRLRVNLEKNVEASNDVAKDVVALTERATELKRAVEEADRKRWQLTLALVGSLIAFILSLVANLILLIVRSK